jgi:phosphate transport system substrate-binding protein
MTRLSLLGFLLLLTTACRAQPLPAPTAVPTAPAAATLRIGLTDSARSLADVAGAGYLPANERAVIEFVPGNNAALFADLDAGLLDAILVHHIAESSNHWFNPVALDGLVIVVHAGNPLDVLSRGQAQAIFSGRIGNWQNVGGPDQPIVLMSRERGSGARTIFNERVLAEQRLAITAVIQPDNRSLLAAVAAEPGAVGYAMMGDLNHEVRALALDGLEATTATTGDQTYPLTIPLYFVAHAEPGGELRAFLAWLQSESGQSLLGGKYGRVR